MTMDISNFYLITPLKQPKYVRIKLSNVSEEIINQYNLQEKASTKSLVYTKITKGMYRLPQT